MPGAGELTERIQIDRFASSTNSLNETIKTWSELTTVWARRQEKNGGEAVAAGQVAADSTTLFLVRHSTTTASVTAKDRIVYDGATWNIRDVRPANMGRDRFIWIEAACESN